VGILFYIYEQNEARLAEVGEKRYNFVDTNGVESKEMTAGQRRMCTGYLRRVSHLSAEK
jgi:hypothetical protein